MHSADDKIRKTFLRFPGLPLKKERKKGRKKEDTHLLT